MVDNNKSMLKEIKKHVQKIILKFTIFAPRPNLPRVCFKPYFVPDRTASTKPSTQS